MTMGVGTLPRGDNGEAVLGLWDDATGLILPVHVGAKVTGADGKTYALLDVNATVSAAANQRVNTHAGDIAAGSAVSGAFVAGAIADLSTLPASLTELLGDTDNLASLLTQETSTATNTGIIATDMAELLGDTDNLATLATNTADLLIDGDNLVTNTANIPAKGTAAMVGSMPVTISTDDTLTTAIKNSVAAIPAKGAATKANAMPVTMASDQPAQAIGASAGTAFTGDNSGAALQVSLYGKVTVAGDTVIAATAGNLLTTQISSLNGAVGNKAAMPVQQGATSCGTQIDTSATGTNATVTATMSAVAAKSNYLTGFEITGLAGSSLGSGDITISGLANTLTGEFTTSITAGGSLVVEFNPPRVASGANVAVSVAVAALGASSGKVSVMLHGFNV